MALSGTAQVAVLVVRLWPEPASPAGLLARVTGARHADGELEQVAVVATADDLADAVRDWALGVTAAWAAGESGAPGGG